MQAQESSNSFARASDDDPHSRIPVKDQTQNVGELNGPAS